MSPLASRVSAETRTERSSWGRGHRRMPQGPADFQAPPVPAGPQVPLYLNACRTADGVLALLLLVAAFLATNVGRMPMGMDDFLAYRITIKNLLLLAGFLAGWRLIFELFGLYRWERIRNTNRESHRVLLACAAGTAVALIFPAVSVTGAFRVASVLLFGASVSLATCLSRRLLRRALLGPADALSRLVVVGSGPRAMRLAQALRQDRSRYLLVGYVDGRHAAMPPELQGQLLGGLDELEGILAGQAVDEVLIALPVRSHYSQIQQALDTCMRIGVRAKYLADTFDTGRTGLRYELADEGAVLALPVTAEDHRLLLKRAMDLVLGTVALILVSPIMLLAAVAVKLSSPGAVFFVQERYGYNRRRFRMYKFRSMIEEAESLQGTLESRNEAQGPVFKIREDPRVTWIGRLLRRTSIDELPQLFNVLRGDMSLVGPRPLPLRDVGRFPDAALMRRFSVKPGITCLWQIRGRSNLGFDEWIALDLKYIDEWSLALDCRTLLATIPVVIRGSGAE